MDGNHGQDIQIVLSLGLLAILWDGCLAKDPESRWLVKQRWILSWAECWLWFSSMYFLIPQHAHSVKAEKSKRLSHVAWSHLRLLSVWVYFHVCVLLAKTGHLAEPDAGGVFVSQEA